MPCMSRQRVSRDLTIRLTAKERSALDRAAEKRGERAVSAWARAVLLREAARETDEERARRVARLIAEMRRGFPGDAEHAEDVERRRAQGWNREDR